LLEGLSNADSQDMAAGILASCPDCVKLLSADGTILFMNAQGVALNELDAVEDVLGKNFADLWPADEREKVRLAIRGAAKDGRPASKATAPPPREHRAGGRSVSPRCPLPMPVVRLGSWAFHVISRRGTTPKRRAGPPRRACVPPRRCIGRA
jgi:hypothetical protein